MISELVLVRLDNVSLELFVRHDLLLPVLYPSLVHLELGQGLFLQLALLLLLQILHDLHVPLPLQNHFFPFNFLGQGPMKLFCLAFVQSLLHLNFLLLNLLFVLVILIVICLRFKFILERLNPLVFLLLEHFPVLFHSQLLFVPLYLQAVLVFHIFGSQLVLLHSNLNLLFRLALFHTLFDFIQFFYHFLLLGFLSGLADEHAASGYASLGGHPGVTLGRGCPEVPGTDLSSITAILRIGHGRGLEIVVAPRKFEIGVHWQLLAQLLPATRIVRR